MLAQLVSVALTASVKATDTKSVSSFNHFLIDFIYLQRALIPTYNVAFFLELFVCLFVCLFVV